MGPERDRVIALTAVLKTTVGRTIVAIDGRSSSGKTTLARRLAALTERSAVVHTDDVAWWHSRFGWADLLIERVLRPFREGAAVSFRPPAWDEHDRDGSLEVPADTAVLVVEGVGSGRRELAEWMDQTIWVWAEQTDVDRRNYLRVGQPGGPATENDLLAWLAEENPFLDEDRPWERATVIVNGSSARPYDPRRQVVVVRED
ncbi:MAG TPA: hypothetical protein VGF84_17090 [Micromonosporaceae bacterium]